MEESMGDTKWKKYKFGVKIIFIVPCIYASVEESECTFSS